MSTMDHNARSVVAAWRATDTTIFTKHLAGASPSGINSYIVDTYMDIAHHLQHVVDRLLNEGFPPQHDVIRYIQVLIDVITANAQQTDEWRQALAKAEAELP